MKINFKKQTDFYKPIKLWILVVRTEYQLGIFIMQYQWTEARLFADEHLGFLDKTERFDSLNSYN